MKYLVNQIGISALSILLATATCNNSASSSENNDYETAIAAADAAMQAPATPAAAEPEQDKALEKRDTVEIKTSMGDITVVLYNETPQHRDNFLKHVNSGYYDGILFHRVIRNFMIQTGDPLSKDSDPSNDGTGGPGYRVPAEFVPGLKHNKGTLAAARDNNPEMASSGSQFYICHAAAPWLDGQYTIFGETISGLDVVDKIASSKTGMNDRPLEDIKILSTRHVNAPKSAAAAPAGKDKKSSKKNK